MISIFTGQRATNFSCYIKYKESLHLKTETHALASQVYGLATYGHHHMNRVKFGWGGGGCPTKGGDAGVYPWGDCGGGFAGVNYEEINPLCDAFLLDIKFWANLNEPWNEAELFLGNAADVYSGKNQTNVTYQAEANLYGRYSDPYNVERGIKNPQELDFTEDHKIHEKPSEDTIVPVVNFTIDFGRVGKVNDFNNVTLDFSPRQCLNNELVSGSHTQIAAVSACILSLALLLVF